MRAAIYARCSTNDQSVGPQLDALRAYAVARRLEVVEEFLDEGFSGARDRRPALDRLMAAAKRREFETLVVVKLDRLARSTRHLTALAAELEALGVDLVVIDQGLDTSTPAGRLLFNVLAAIGEFELDLIRERTRAGIDAARRRGKRIGRPRTFVPLGRAQALLEAGLSVSATARELGVARSTLRRELAKTPPAEAPPST